MKTVPKFSRLELKNFKSYKNEVCFNWEQFSSIIGPNGAGKSSIVDAIQFVFCFPRFDKISIQRLKEDICNKINIKENDYSRTWVRVTLNCNEKKIVFQRLVDFDKSIYIYSIDDIDVNIKKYKICLAECNINTKANNFIVQQNSIENIAMKGAKERCEFFEHICNSIAYKGEYMSLSKNLQEAYFEIEQLKKDLNFQLKLKKELLKVSKETEKYNILSDELSKVQLDYYFLKLYQIDKNIDELSGIQNETKSCINVAKKLKQSKENIIDNLKNELNNHELSTKELEEEVESTQCKLFKYSTKMLELNQKTIHCEDSIKKIEKNLIKAETVDAARMENIKELKKQYFDVEKSKQSYEKSETQPCSIKLEDEQYEEYLKLKSEAQQKFAKEVGLFDSIERERDAIKTNIDAVNYESRVTLLSEQIKRKKMQLKKKCLEIDSINEKIKDKEISESKIQVKNEIVESEMKEMQKQIEYLHEELEILEKRISDSNMSKEEDRKMKRKTDVLSQLKANFLGIHERLKNLITVENEYYYIAVMKILGKNMDNIVVDNRFTAIKCMEFLKKTYNGDKFSTYETFLPLDYIPRKKYDDEVFKQIRDQPNTKRVSDVIATQSEDIMSLVCNFYNIENVIICETDDEACDLSSRRKLNCVSLNGTYYKNNGQFSGGLANLLQQLKKWNYKEYEDLKEKKQKDSSLLNQLKTEINNKQKQNHELTIELEEIKKSLEKNLKPFVNNRKNELLLIEKELCNLEEELHFLVTSSNIKELQDKFDAKTKELEKMENKKNSIEDEIFLKFCEKFHIPNIRKYEHGDLKQYKERINRKKEYKVHLDKIKNEIDYEKSRNTKSTVLKLQAQLNELKEVLHNLKENENKLKNLISKNKDCSKKKELQSIKIKIEEIRKNIKLEEFQCKSIRQDLVEWNSLISSKAVKISNLKFNKHKLLMECKINNINIPLLDGTIDNIILDNAVESTATESSGSSGQHSIRGFIHEETKIEINYLSLTSSYKNLLKDELKKEIISLRNKQNSITAELQILHPKLKSTDNLKSVQENMKILNKDYKKKLAKLGIIRKKLNDVKTSRRSIFYEFFNSVAEQIDGIFKNLYRNSAAQACINVRNAEEPYLDGIEFSCIIPKKKFIPMQNLSGGEKTMSAVALLLAIYRVKPAPFIIFDEIDAALDNSNINKIANHLLQLKSSMQIINISHHELLSSCADSVIGINISPRTNSTYVVHINLNQYKKNTVKHKCLKNKLIEKPLLLQRRMENDSITE